jgi:hypothetical protein
MPRTPRHPEKTGAGVTILSFLFARVLLFPACQAFIAAGYFVVSSGFDRTFSTAWGASCGWFPVCASATNVFCFFLMRREGFDAWKVARAFRGPPWLWNDLRTALVAIVFAVLLGAMAFNPAAEALFPWDPSIPEKFMIRPIPVWASVCGAVLFPLTQGLVELPFYVGFVAPRLDRLTRSRLLTWLIVTTILAAQHSTLPLVFDWRFAVWRSVSFLPSIMFLTGFLRWKLHLLPYFMVVHGVIDISPVIPILLMSLD